MGSTRNSFLSTYQTTQPTKCLYFDGASGALAESGTMDTQMLFLFGNTTGPPGRNSSAEFLWDEYARAQRLCGWLQERGLDAPGQGIEGIVRMSAGFELIWCNFSSPSLRLVSRFNVSVPLLGYNRTASLNDGPEKFSQDLIATEQGKGEDLPAPDWEIDWDHEPFIASQQWDWFMSSSRAYSSEDLASTREPTIRLLDTELICMYSPEFQQLLAVRVEHDRERLNLTSDGFWKGSSDRESRRDAIKQLMRRRSRHHVGNLTPQEVDKFRDGIEHMVNLVVGRNFHNNNNHNHGPHATISWSHTCDLIVNSFSKRLIQLQRLLQRESAAAAAAAEPDGSPIPLQRQFALLRERTHALLMPFFDYSSESSETGTPSGTTTEPIQPSLRRCKSAYLPWRIPNAGQDLPKSHRFIAEAIEEVLHGICSVLIGAGLAIERIWLREFNHGRLLLDDPGKNPLQQPPSSAEAEMRVWSDRIEELTAWLGWAPHWMRCPRLCAWDEECYIPIWPILRQILGTRKPAYGNYEVDVGEVEFDLWHPRCLKVG
ncbi:MAG: hypothetical protein Q9182_002017 [Xanthomendoza sp. 2 TL-2023]